MRTRRLPLWLTCTLFVPACFEPSDDPLADDTATGEASNADDDGMTVGDDGGSTGMTSADDDPTDDPTNDPTDDPTDGSTSTDPDSTTDPSADGSSTDGTEMPCDGSCVAAAPEGWNGPVLLASATDRPASCDDATYAQPSAGGYAGIEAADASCDCDCGVAEAAVCDDEGNLGLHSDPDCDGGFPEAIPIELGCTNIANESPAYWTWEPTASGGECEASASVVVPQLGYTGQLAACGTDATASGACEGDGECVPAPSGDAALCWWSEGDVECPESLGGVREVIYTEDPTDTRGCESCTCGDPEIWCDAPGVVLVGSNDTCNTTQVMPLPPIGLAPGECQAASSVLSVFWQVVGTPHTVCDSPSDPQPTGAATPQGPITVCCAG